MGGWMGKVLDINLTTGEILTRAAGHGDGSPVPGRARPGRAHPLGRGRPGGGTRFRPTTCSSLPAARSPAPATRPATASRSAPKARSPAPCWMPIPAAFGACSSNAPAMMLMIVRGKAERPVYIEIKPDGVRSKTPRTCGASASWKRPPLLGQNNNKRNVLCIGPAGENLSRIAAIMNDGAAQPGARRSRRGDGQQEPQGHRGRGQTAPRDHRPGAVQIHALRDAQAAQAPARSPARRCPSSARW